MEIRQITAADTLSLRAKVLRPHHTAQNFMTECQFPGDEGPLAGHFGVFVERDEGAQGGDQLIAVSTIYPEKLPDPVAMELALKRQTPVDFDFSASTNSAEIWRLRGMATDPGHRSLGAGSAMLAECMGHVRDHQGRLIWANARIAAIKFYEQNGFRVLGEEYDLPGVGPHYLIYLIL